MNKLAFIKKLPNGKYRVLSEKGKNLGTFDSEKEAKERLKQVEYFKHSKANKKIDLTKLDELSLSAVMRELNKQTSESNVLEFMKIYHSLFNSMMLKSVDNLPKITLIKTLIEFNKEVPVKIDKSIVKEASITELGDPAEIGKYLAGIVKFTLNKISLKNRAKSINSVKNKLSMINPNEIAQKNMPVSASMGSSIVFIKHILYQHDPHYIKEVLDEVVRNL